MPRKEGDGYPFEMTTQLLFWTAFSMGFGSGLDIMPYRFSCTLGDSLGLFLVPVVTLSVSLSLFHELPLSCIFG